MVFTAESGITVTGLKIDGESVAKGSGGSNWSVSGGNVVTIKKAYLAALAEGDHTVTFLFDGGTDADATITVEDSTT